MPLPSFAMAPKSAAAAAAATTTTAAAAASSRRRASAAVTKTATERGRRGVKAHVARVNGGRAGGGETATATMAAPAAASGGDDAPAAAVDTALRSGMGNIQMPSEFRTGTKWRMGERERANATTEERPAFSFSFFLRPHSQPLLLILFFSSSSSSTSLEPHQAARPPDLLRCRRRPPLGRSRPHPFSLFRPSLGCPPRGRLPSHQGDVGRRRHHARRHGRLLFSLLDPLSGPHDRPAGVARAL